MQLDIFDHSRDTMLRNDVVHALERRDAREARAAWRILSGEFPRDHSVPLLALLIDAIDGPACTPFANHDAASTARGALAGEIEPAALGIFGASTAAGWLAPLWRQLAQRAAALAFRAERSEDHAAPLWLLAGDWPAACEAVAGIESWRRIPAPLGWMAEARYRIDGLDDAWPLFAELAWLSPSRFDRLTKRLADPSLEKLRKRFDASFEGDGNVADLAWFPAWALTEKPGLSGLLGQTQRSLNSVPEQAMRLLLELLGLERQGRHHDVVERRKALRDTHPSLYAAYMATR